MSHIYRDSSGTFLPYCVYKGCIISNETVFKIQTFASGNTGVARWLEYTLGLRELSYKFQVKQYDIVRDRYLLANLSINWLDYCPSWVYIEMRQRMVFHVLTNHTLLFPLKVSRYIKNHSLACFKVSIALQNWTKMTMLPIK